MYGGCSTQRCKLILVPLCQNDRFCVCVGGGGEHMHACRNVGGFCSVLAVVLPMVPAAIFFVRQPKLMVCPTPPPCHPPTPSRAIPLALLSEQLIATGTQWSGSMKSRIVCEILPCRTTESVSGWVPTAYLHLVSSAARQQSLYTFHPDNSYDTCDPAIY